MDKCENSAGITHPSPSLENVKGNYLVAGHTDDEDSGDEDGQTPSVSDGESTDRVDGSRNHQGKR